MVMISMGCGKVWPEESSGYLTSLEKRGRVMMIDFACEIQRV